MSKKKKFFFSPDKLFTGKVSPFLASFTLGGILRLNSLDEIFQMKRKVYEKVNELSLK